MWPALMAKGLMIINYEPHYRHLNLHFYIKYYVEVAVRIIPALRNASRGALSF